MTQIEKLIKRLMARPTPKDFSWKELEKLLNQLGFILSNAGKTSGSRVRFIHESTRLIIMLHKPHPSPNLKKYQLEDIINKLQEEKLI